MKYLLLIIALYSYTVSAQVKIGDNPNSINPSSILEIESTDKGVLIPRVALVSTTNTSPISSPAVSLMVYNTATANDVTPGYYYWNGTNWSSFTTAQKKQISINCYSTGLGGVGSRSVYVNGNVVSTAARGVHLTVLSGSTGNVIFSKNYDTHGTIALGTNCANDINTYNTNRNVLILNTWDQPRNINTDLLSALKDVMLSKEIAYETMDYRCAFCIIYQNGRGKLGESTSNAHDDSGAVIGNGNTIRANAACSVVTFIN